MEWMSKLIDLLLEHSPLQYIGPDERGVYCLFGRIAWNAPPGVYILLPLVEKVEKRTVTPQPLLWGQCGAQTTDGKPYTVDGELEWQIVDVRKTLFCAVDVAGSIRLRVHSAVTDFLTANASESVNTDGLKAAISAKLSRVVRNRFGAEVLEVTVRDVVQARPIRLMQHVREEE
ncbi:MAG: SPFH domain-containing protein [Planctomycetota bacterium]|jgi:regulator of protease activity HflC (stomatin/prohibitin superfamily)